MMDRPTLILLFDDDRMWLTDHKWLPINALSLPSHIKAISGTAWWKVTVLNFNNQSKEAFVDVVAYNTGQQPIPEHQYPNDPWCEEVETISFKSIKTFELLRTLPAKHDLSDGTVTANSFHPEDIAHKAEQEKMDGAMRGFPLSPQTDETQQHEASVAKKFTLSLLSQQRQIFDETFTVWVKHLRFKLGCVAIDYTLKPLGIKTEVTISNHDLREEFDAVKNYFANVLRTNRITVKARFEVQGTQIISCEASSPEIARINRQMIDSVKFEFVGDFTHRKLKFDVDRSLFTSDELFEKLTEGRMSRNAFYDEEKDLMNDLLQIANTKHYRNLRYLSDLHLHHVMRLRFIIRPFSFIFLINGDQHYHLVWETLDTEEATYVWHIPRDREKAQLMLRKIESIVNVVKVQGKTAYINTADDQYHRIYHDYSELADGFLKWKAELESLLT